MGPFDHLLQSAYPAVIIERWTGFDGWPCFRVSLIESEHAEPQWDGHEYSRQDMAEDAAKRLSSANGDCPVINMHRGGHNG